MSTLLFILKNLDEYKWRFWTSMLAGFVASCSGIAIPLLLAEFTKSGLSRDDFIVLISWLLVAIITSLASSWVIRRYGEAFANQFPNHLRLKYFRQLEQLPLSQLAKNHSGYVLSMVDQIGSRMVGILYDIFWWFMGIIVNIGLLVYFTATKSWGLTILNLVLFLGFVVISTFLARKQTKLAGAMNEGNAVFGQYFVDFMTNLGTVKRLGVRNFADTRLSQRRAETNQLVQQFQNAHSNRWLLLHSIYYSANIATIGYLLYQISIGAVPVSLLILFVAFYSNLRGIIERVAENIITFAEVRVYVANLDKILKTDEADASQRSHPKWKEVSLKDIHYQHADNEALIRIPDFTVKKGDKVCLYGKSGEGKTTILNILANYLPVDSGQRQVDNLSYESLGKAWFAREFAFISQETELFNLSLRDNLVLGQDISDDKLWKLLEDLHLADWVRGLDKGLATVLGEKGLRLSAGQKQRVNLARGILLDRSIYLLDEPTSHLDDATEKVVIKATQKYLAKKTIIVVTHRPAIKKICNRFYEMKGHVVSIV